MNLHFKPLVYTSYYDIKDIVSLLKEFYIQEYGEEYRKKISDNFDHTNYIFLMTSKQLEMFIKKYLRILTKIINEKILSVVPIEGSIGEYIRTSINKELDKIESIDLEQNISINDIIQKIKLILKKIIEEPSKVEKINGQIKYLEENIPELKVIEEQINSQRRTLVKLKKLKNQIRVDMQRDFLFENDYLLSREEYRKICNKEIDIEEVIKGSKILKMYINSFFLSSVFDIGRFSAFKEEYNDNDFFIDYRRDILNEFGIAFNDNDLLNPSVCLSKLNFMIKDKNGIPHYSTDGLEVLDSLLEDYNARYKKEIEDIDYYLMPKEEFTRKNLLSDEVLDRKTNIHIKNLLKRNDVSLSDYDFFVDEFCEAIENRPPNEDGTTISISVGTSENNEQMIYVLLRPLLCVDYSSKEFNSSFLFTLSHEMGHVATKKENGVTGFELSNIQTLLNELFNEYLSNKIVNKILSKYSKQLCNVKNRSLYNMNSFLIEPFVIEYEGVFKKASINNNLDPLIELFGTRLFYEYIDLIRSFFEEQAKYNSRIDIFKKNPQYVGEIVQKIHNIYQCVKKNKNRII